MGLFIEAKEFWDKHLLVEGIMLETWRSKQAFVGMSNVVKRHGGTMWN